MSSLGAGRLFEVWRMALDASCHGRAGGPRRLPVTADEQGAGGEGRGHEGKTPSSNLQAPMKHKMPNYNRRTWN